MKLQIKKTSPKLYKLDADGQLRVWWGTIYQVGEMTLLGTSYGVYGGAMTNTKTQEVEPKNVGKKNERNSSEQAEAELDAMVKDKLTRGRYTTDPAGVLIAHTPKPMLAKNFNQHSDEIWESEGIICQQPKLDGIRCLANKDGMWTRMGKDISSCPHILEETKILLDFLPDGSFIDGELYNHDLKDNFQKITSLVRRKNVTKESLEETKKLVKYYVYDVSGTDEFWKRYTNFYMKVMDLDLKYIEFVMTTTPADDEDIEANHSTFINDGYEGSIIRWGKEGYEEKRSKHLLKKKDFDSDEFRVLQVEEGKGDWQGAVKRFVLDINGKSFGAGVRGEREELTKLWKADNYPDWATIRYFGLTNDGLPRFPVVVDYGYDERKD